jgi:hypothetical protein
MVFVCPRPRRTNADNPGLAKHRGCRGCCGPDSHHSDAEERVNQNKGFIMRDFFLGLARNDERQRKAVGIVSHDERVFL